MENPKYKLMTLKELDIYINRLRKEMILYGLKLGFQHEKTIKASQELDYFIYAYQTLLKNLRK